jgi:hypothetical protein
LPIIGKHLRSVFVEENTELKEINTPAN